MGNEQSVYLANENVPDQDGFELQQRKEMDTKIEDTLELLPVLSLSTSTILPPPKNPSSPLPPLTTGVVYDQRMCLHQGSSSHPERPNRTRSIAHHLVMKGLMEKCVRIPAREATEEEKKYVHTESEIEVVHTHWKKNDGSDKVAALIDGDTYVCQYVVLSSFSSMTLINISSS